MSISKLESRHIATNGISLHVMEAGHVGNPLAILLHGFPEFWMGWNKQIDALVEIGFRVWIPDQRGYNKSDKPRGVAEYRLDVLVDDIVGLIHASGEKHVFLFGHDWGGAVAWRLTQRHPELVRRLVVVNSPRLEVLRRALDTDWKQQLKSWYFWFFRIPAVPELFLSMINYRRLARILVSGSRTGSFSKPELARYREAWRQPGAVTGMLNWYRAMWLPSDQPLPNSRIKVKTLLIWGINDRALGKELARQSIDLCDEGELLYFKNCTHWVLHEKPEKVNQRIIDFLKRGWHANPPAVSETGTTLSESDDGADGQ